MKNTNSGIYEEVNKHPKDYKMLDASFIIPVEPKQTLQERIRQQVDIKVKEALKVAEQHNMQLVGQWQISRPFYRNTMATKEEGYFQGVGLTIIGWAKPKENK